VGDVYNALLFFPS